MDHLRTGDGVEDYQIVQEQVGVHKVGAWDPDEGTAPAPFGADLYSDGWEYHSNIHLGELYWESDPSDPHTVPETSLGIEVDYYVDADPRALEALDRVEQNFRLYGFDVRMIPDEELTDDDLVMWEFVPGYGLAPKDRTPPTTFSDARAIRDTYHQNRSNAYMFISTEGGKNPEPIMPDWIGVDGTASSDGSDIVLGHLKGLGFGTAIFTEDHTGGRQPTETYLQKTMMHEVGHLIGAGRADDKKQFVVFPDEIYSGSPRDETLEGVGYSGLGRYRWSVMSAGWNYPIDYPPMNGDYIAFSIEELSTINFENIDTVEEDT